jgi:hypothetical protein
MKKNVFLWTLAILMAFVLGCSTPHVKNAEANLNQANEPSPFSISMVPDRSGPFGPQISMATNTLDTFYVILKNISNERQLAFGTAHSWGYYAVSFELQMPDGRIVKVTKKPQGFTRNIPSTFMIPPGEQMVFPITLDDLWDAVPPLLETDKTPAITIKAIYEVKPTPESAEQKVWTGRMESKGYNFTLWHWSEQSDTDRCKC